MTTCITDVELFLAANPVKQCAPAAARGATMNQGSRRFLAKQRKAWSEANATPLKVGMIARPTA